MRQYVPVAIILTALVVLAMVGKAMEATNEGELTARDTPQASPSATPSPTPPALVLLEELDPPRRVIFGVGDHVGYRFDPRGRVLERKILTLPSGSSAEASARYAHADQTEYLEISSGFFQGFLVPIGERVHLAQGG